MMKRTPLYCQIWKNRVLFLMLLPGLALILVFCYGPMYGLLMAFKQYNLSLGVWGSPDHDAQVSLTFSAGAVV